MRGWGFPDRSSCTCIFRASNSCTFAMNRFSAAITASHLSWTTIVISSPRASENFYLVAIRELEAKCDFMKFRQSTMRHLKWIKSNDDLCIFMTINVPPTVIHTENTVTWTYNILILDLIQNSDSWNAYCLSIDCSFNSLKKHYCSTTNFDLIIMYN